MPYTQRHRLKVLIKKKNRYTRFVVIGDSVLINLLVTFMIGDSVSHGLGSVGWDVEMIM